MHGVPTLLLAALVLLLQKTLKHFAPGIRAAAGTTLPECTAGSIAATGQRLLTRHRDNWAGPAMCLVLCCPATCCCCCTAN
jgi:hypothetical protein